MPKSLHLDPESYDVHYLYGRTCTLLGRAELAVRHMERAAALSETDYTALALVSQSYRALHRIEQANEASCRALARIEKAIARRPDDTIALFLGAAILAELGQADRAREWANRASLLAPDDALGHYNLGCAFALLGEKERAIDFLERGSLNWRTGFVTWAKNDSDLDSLRNHPRYRELIQREEARLADAESQSSAGTDGLESGA